MVDTIKDETEKIAQFLGLNPLGGDS